MKMLRKIAMVAACPFPYSRGTPIRIYKMAEALAKRGHDVHIITYHLGNITNGFPFRIHRIPEIKSYKVYSPGPNYRKLLLLDPLLFLELKKTLKHNEIDIIHAHNYEGLLVSLFLRRSLKKPVIYDAHTLLESELPYYGLGLSHRIKKKIGHHLDHWLPGKADHIISVTDRIRTKLISAAAIVPEKITTIMNGVEAEHFSNKNGDHKLYHSREKTLIFTGNLAFYQGIDLLLRIFQQVLNVRQDVRLLIISDSSFDYYEPLAKALNVRDKISIIKSGFEELPEHFAHAHIALNPRIDCDGIPQKLLNYMAAGKPVVSFESSGSSLKHRINALIVEDGNIPAFANAIFQLLDDENMAKALGENAREYITSHFSWENTAEITETVYEEVLSKN